MKTKFHGLFHGFICEFYLKKKIIKTKGVFMHLKCKQNFTFFFSIFADFCVERRSQISYPDRIRGAKGDRDWLKICPKNH